jgi:hypothetical protein
MHFSEAQFTSVAATGRQGFLRRAEAYLAQLRPDWGGTAALLPGFIDAGLRKADSLAIRREIDAIRFLELMWRLGPDRWAAEQEWIHEYLGEKRVADERLELVFERLQVEGKVPR